MPVLAPALGELYFKTLPIQERSPREDNLLPETPQPTTKGCPRDWLGLLVKSWSMGLVPLKLSGGSHEPIIPSGLSFRGRGAAG